MDSRILLHGLPRPVRSILARRSDIFVLVRTEGYWASRAAQTLVGRSPYASGYYIAWLAILEDEPGRHELTPFHFLSEDLCGLVPFWQLACQIPPSSHGFSRNFHRYNHSAMVMNRFGHWITTCYQRNFNSTFITGLDFHLAKVVYIQGKCSPGILSQLKDFRVPPIVLCDDVQTLRACADADLKPSMIQDIKPADLIVAVGRLFGAPSSNPLGGGAPSSGLAAGISPFSVSTTSRQVSTVPT